MTDLDIPEIAAYRARCASEGRAPADLSSAFAHAHALPDHVRQRQLARQAVTRATEALEQAEHAERLAGDAVRRAMSVLETARAALAKLEGGG